MDSTRLLRCVHDSRMLDMSEQPLIATHTPQQVAPPGIMTSMERALSLATGTALVANGLRRGGLGGILQIVVGAYGVLRGATGHCALKHALMPTPFEQRFSAEHDWPISEALSRSVTISRPLDEVRDFLAQPEKVGALLRWVESVESLGPDRTCWTVRAPVGRKLQWTLISVPTETPDELQWHTPEGTRWQHDVSVHLSEAPGSRGTQVKAVVVRKPSFGKIGYGIARAISAFSDKALLNALQAVKQQMETGEVTTSRLRPDDDNDFFYVHGQPEDEATSSHSPDSIKTGVAVEGGVV
ncbi:Cye/dehydrase [Pseudomonas syringae pv. spinaceae]|uniref:Cye/dehydrase n=2 Tax=Pseudomonas syringae TaxID=317 RepID=A0A0Q0I5H9_PSESX|nr:Cye/dehydrase [Pseudomonas syringae pv. spinaceae]RMT29369.1 Cye/dehydrase [Pseudomonas syringae pv. spinaceae]